MRLIKVSCILLFGLLMSNSCVNNLDFDNTELKIKPIFNSPVVFFTLNQLDFFDEAKNVEKPEINTIVGDFNILQSADVIRDNLVRVEFNIEIANEFNRDIAVKIDYLDDLNNVTHSINSFTVPANEDDFTFLISIGISDNPTFLESTKSSITLNMAASSTTLNPAIPMEFNFKLKGTYFF